MIEGREDGQEEEIQVMMGERGLAALDISTLVPSEHDTMLDIALVGATQSSTHSAQSMFTNRSNLNEEDKSFE